MARITDFTGLYPHVHAELPGCPQPLYVQHLLRSARALCEKSRVWREDLDPYDITDDEKEYTLAPTVDGTTYNARIECLIEVRQNTEDGVTNGDKGTLINWRDYSFNPNTLVLTFDTAPSDDITDGLEVKAVLVPHLGASDITEWILNNYAEVILAGCKYKLLAMTNKTWSNTTLAAEYRTEWRNGIAKAKADIAREYKDGSSGVSP